jgi:hypothetical protein
MNMLDRYLRAVEFWLPRDQREDVIAELSDDLRSQIDDREGKLGRPLTEAELGTLLAGRGNPAAMAARYLPQRHLIGPEAYPVYRFVLKMLGLFYLVPAALVGIVLMVVNATVRPVVPDLTPWGLIEYLWLWGIHAFTIVTIGFALMQRSSVRERLGRLGERRDPLHASRFESATDLVLSVVMTGLGLRLLSGIALGEARIAPGVVGAPFVWAVIALYALNAALAMGRLARPRWTPSGTRLQLATTGALLLVFAGMLAASLLGADAVSIAIPSAEAEKVARLQRWANASAWLTMVVGVLIAVFHGTVRLRWLRDDGVTDGPVASPPARTMAAGTRGPA